MLYLDLAKYKDDLLKDEEKKLSKIFINILYFFRKYIGKVFKYKLTNNSTVVVLSKINKKTLKKLDKILKIEVASNICICEELITNESLDTFLKEKNLRIMNGRWLFYYLICEVINYICESKKEPVETQEISILTNKYDSFTLENIKRIAKKVKIINVITNNIKELKTLEDSLYEDEVILLNVTNNYKKAVLKSNIILNFDFAQKDLNKIKYPQNSIIINLQSTTQINQKNFGGIEANFYSINLPIKYKDIYNKLNNFNSAILYESLIYKKTLYFNIWKEIENDEIKIISLENNNKMIKFKNFQTI